VIRRFSFAISAMAILAHAPAMAADLAAAPSYKTPLVASAPWSWTGFYVGAHAGYGWNDAKVSVVPGATWGVAGGQWLIDNGSPALQTSAALGGLQAGYNFQTANWVWGVEADFSFTGIRGGRSTGLLVPPPAATMADRAFTENDSVEWVSTFRGRLGYAVQQNLLIYATGGLAVGRHEFSQFILTSPAFSFNNIRNSVSETKVGWAAGGGLEYALSRNWSVKGEYLYIDLGKVSSTADSDTAPGFGLTVNSASRATLHTVRAGLNYKFDWAGPVVAKY
jgi:outer membrane immunogenic protein